MEIFWAGLVSGIAIGSIYALVALGFTFVFASTRVVNFAQGDWAMIAGMVGASVATSRSGLTGAVIVAPLVGALVGGTAYVAFVAWSRSLDVLTVSLALLGMSFVLEGVALWIWGPNPLGISSLIDRPPLHLGSIAVTQISVIIVCTAAGLLGLIAFFLRLTTYGRAMVAVAMNPQSAALDGINVRLVILLSFVMSGALAGIAGLLVTPVISMTYQGGFPLTLKAFAAAALGGLRGPVAAVVGGLVLGVIESMSATYISGDGWGQTLSIALALLMMLAVAPRFVSKSVADLGHGELGMDVDQDTARL